MPIVLRRTKGTYLLFSHTTCFKRHMFQMTLVSNETSVIWNLFHLKQVSFETCVIWNMWHVRTEGIYLLFFLLLWAFNTMFFQTNVVWSRNNNSRINTWKYRNSKDDNYSIWRQFWSYIKFKEWSDLFELPKYQQWIFVSLRQWKLGSRH